MSSCSQLSDDDLVKYHEMYKKGLDKSSRFESRKIHNFDCKFGYHVVRLMLECEQILREGTIDLQRHRKQLRAVKNGEWTEEQVREFFAQKEKDLETVYNSCSLRETPATGRIKQLLLDCLEHHFGSFSEAEILLPDRYKSTCSKIRELLDDLETEETAAKKPFWKFWRNK